MSNGGKVKSNYFKKGYVWFDTMLMNMNYSLALKIIPRTVDGIQFLLVERGGFGKADGSKNWHCGYYGYVRISNKKNSR